MIRSYWRLGHKRVPHKTAQGVQLPHQAVLFPVGQEAALPDGLRLLGFGKRTKIVKGQHCPKIGLLSAVATGDFEVFSDTVILDITECVVAMVPHGRAFPLPIAICFRKKFAGLEAVLRRKKTGVITQ
jgi:hypothetical protein